MIFTSHFYPENSRLSNNDLIIKNEDKRLFVGKHAETFVIWHQYIRKNYPNEHIVIFDEPNSFIPIRESLDRISEPFEFIDSYDYNSDIKLHVKTCSKLDNVKNRSEKGYRQTAAVARSYLDALNFAYATNNDFFYIDLDCFLNTDIYKLIDKNTDIAAQNISFFQFTIDAYCLFISSRRLHEMDGLYRLPDFLNHIFYNTSDIVRIYTFFEGGLAKIFCYGNYKELKNINVTHSTCLRNLLEFFKRNLLRTKEQENFINLLQKIDTEKLIKEGVKVDFDDSTFYE